MLIPYTYGYGSDHLIVNNKKVPLTNALTVTTDQPLDGTYMLDWYRWDDSKGFSIINR